MHIRKGGLETKRPTQAQSDLDALQGPSVACFNQLYGFTSVVFILFFSVVPWKMKGYSAAHEIHLFLAQFYTYTASVRFYEYPMPLSPCDSVSPRTAFSLPLSDHSPSRPLRFSISAYSIVFDYRQTVIYSGTL